MKKAVVIAGALGILVAATLLAKNVIAQAALCGGVKAMTGLSLHTDRIEVGLLKSAVGVRGLRLGNPPGFSDPVMIDIPEVYVDYDLGAFLKQRVHLEEVRLHLKELVVVRNQQGQLNLNSLKPIQESKQQPRGQAATRPSQQAIPEIQIDRLHLQIGKVVYKDYTARGAPLIQEFPINLDEWHQHITNPTVLAGLIVSRALMKTSIARVTGFDLGPLQAQVSEQLTQATQLVGTAVGTAREQLSAATGQVSTGARTTAQGVSTAGKKAVGAAADAVKSTTESLKKALPFGN